MELNKVLVVGNLGADPDMTTSAAGNAVARIVVYSNRTWRDRQSGEKQSEACRINVSAFGKTAEFIGNYFHKGREIFIEGRLHLNEWVNQQGEKQCRLDVIAERVQPVGYDAQQGQNNSPNQNWSQPPQNNNRPPQQSNNQRPPQGNPPPQQNWSQPPQGNPNGGNQYDYFQ